MKEPLEALESWDLEGPICPADEGLINRTFIVGQGPEAVLQWVNPIFDPAIQQDIHALTERLDQKGLQTPRLLPTRSGDLLLEEESGFWRAMTYIPGSTVHRLGSAEQAEAAGELLGRFHQALADWRPEFQAPKRDIHNTPTHMDNLRRAIESSDGHQLEASARKLGRSILDAWQAWKDQQGPVEVPERICHGDPKISNLRFDGSGRTGVCMVDLDTIGFQDLAGEMGDAWRSWCNPAGEEDPEGCDFNLDLFRASTRGWRRTAGPISGDELASLVPAIERICLELAARFCADATQNQYFREDRSRFPKIGSHNLLKARCQFALAGTARDRRSTCESILYGVHP